MSRQERLDHIRRRAQAAREVTVRELADELDVSEMTARRDLSALEREGLLVRTHGGAVATGRVAFEFAFGRDQQTMLDAKRAIAAVACGMIEDGQVVLLDTGTTTLELARLLTAGRALTVVTSSLAIVSTLQFASGVETILLGGFLRGGSPDLWGPITERNLEELHVDWVFVGADGVGSDGRLYCEDLNVARVAERMIAAGERAYVLADSSKIGRKSLTSYGGPEDVRALITDDGIDDAQRRALIESGLGIVVARTGEHKE